MKIVVDVYNALKRFLGVSRISEVERKDFISMIQKYAKEKRNKVVLVFDGGELPYPEKYKKGGVTIINSGYNLIADDVIKDILEVSPSESTVLVSSDGELVRFADTFGIPSMGSTVFFELINRALKKEDRSLLKTIKPIEKTKKNFDHDELDRLIEKSSREIEYKDEDLRLRSSENFRKRIRSKAEKKLLQIIDKL